MSVRVCYIQREDRGALLSRVRLMGRSSDESWIAARGELDPIGEADAGQAANWIAERLESKLGGRTLDRICLDLDGAVCSWVPASAADPGMLRAVIERDTVGGGDDDGFAEVAGEGATRFPDLPNELGYQAIGGSTAVAEGRAAVLAVPEVAARRLVDALDEAGVQVEGCVTLWQAIAGAFSSSSGAASATVGDGDSDRVVAESSPLLATVLCIPGDRIVWAWSRAGMPVAAGSFRTRVGALDSTSSMLLGDGEADDENEQGSQAEGGADSAMGGRLAAEWLAWGAQFGAFPARITWVGPLSQQHDGRGLAPGQIASALRTAAPDATVDVINEADPIGLTLQRFAERLDDEPRAFERADTRFASLSNRPGRMHRAMYHWLSLLLSVAAIAIGAISFDFWKRRDEAAAKLVEVRANQRALLEEYEPELVSEPYAVTRLREMLESAQGPADIDIPAPNPVMAELELLALVLGNPDYQLDSIDITGFAVGFVVRVNDTRAYENLVDSINNIGGSRVNWTSFNPRPDRDKIRVNGTGTWATRTDGGDS